MSLDVRFPIGGMFSIVGALLVIYGVLSAPAIYEKSLGINVNLWWGLVMLAFGLGLLLSATFYGKGSVRGAQETPMGRATE